MKYVLRVLLLILLLLVLLPVTAFYFPFSIQSKPVFKDGDLIFQSTPSMDALGINFATFSLYSHMGIIDMRGDTPYVLDSAGEVTRTSLEEWAARGWGGRFTVYRDSRLSEGVAKEFMAAARPYIGAKYDYFFLLGNEELYCSELPYLMYRHIGLRIGEMQRLGDLSLLNPFTYELIKKRWIYHPQCQALQMKFDQCYEILREQKVISPSAIANDAHLTQLYSNYYGGIF